MLTQKDMLRHLNSATCLCAVAHKLRSRALEQPPPASVRGHAGLLLPAARWCSAAAGVPEERVEALGGARRPRRVRRAGRGPREVGHDRAC